MKFIQYLFLMTKHPPIADELNICFTKADDAFLRYLFDKYKHILPYRSMRDWTMQVGYCYSSMEVWKFNQKIPAKAINLLHKDLLIYRILGYDVQTIQELFQEFKTNIQQDSGN